MTTNVYKRFVNFIGSDLKKTTNKNMKVNSITFSLDNKDNVYMTIGTTINDVKGKSRENMCDSISHNIVNLIKMNADEVGVFNHDYTIDIGYIQMEYNFNVNFKVRMVKKEKSFNDKNFTITF